MSSQTIDYSVSTFGCTWNPSKPVPSLFHPAKHGANMLLSRGVSFAARGLDGDGCDTLVTTWTIFWACASGILRVTWAASRSDVFVLKSSTWSLGVSWKRCSTRNHGMDILKTTKKKAGGRPGLHFARTFATLFPQSHHSEGASGVLERTRDLRTGDGLFGFV